MSYQVIALKWRPDTFDRMVGQKHIGQTLLNALKNERLPQAMLFTGPRGTGKTSTARILAKSLRCLNAKDFVPCGECSECIDIASGRSLDVIEIDGASNNGVDSIRELRESVSFRPTSGLKKVYIIDEVHMLSLSAFNALLKTLEEPPDHVIFILATTEVHKIPKTILSRCHRFDFRKVSTKELSERLEFICTEEKVKFETEALWALARQGEGSVRDSFSYLDQVITYTDGHVTYDSVIESLGLTDRRLLTTILTDIVETQTDSLLTHMEDIFKSGADVGVFAEDFLEQIKNLLIVKSSNDASHFLDLPESEVQILKQISTNISEAHIHLLFDMMLEITQNLMRTQDQRTVLEVGLLKLCLYPRVLDLQKSPAPSSKLNANLSSSSNTNVNPRTEASRNVKSNPAVESSKDVHTPLQTKSTPTKTMTVDLKSDEGPTSYNEEQESEISLTPEQQKWHDFVAKVGRMNAKVGATLQNCLYAFKANEVWISAPEKLSFIKTDIVKPQFQKILSNYIKTFLGPEFVLKINQNDLPKTSAPQSEKTAVKEQEDMTVQEKKRLIEKINNSEAILKMKETFKDAEIVAIKEIK